MSKFEYKTEVIKLGGTILSKRSLNEEELTSLLNRYGSKGWELVSEIDIQTSGWTRTITLIFKRAL